MAKRSDKTNKCQMCGGKVKKDEIFCCEECEKMFGAYMDISISSLFVEKAVKRTSAEELVQVFRDYAIQKGYDLSLFSKKLMNQYRILVVF